MVKYLSFHNSSFFCLKILFHVNGKATTQCDTPPLLCAEQKGQNSTTDEETQQSDPGLSTTQPAGPAGQRVVHVQVSERGLDSPNLLLPPFTQNRGMNVCSIWWPARQLAMQSKKAWTDTTTSLSLELSWGSSEQV